jgi:FkbM family methyltransferase
MSENTQIRSWVEKTFAAQLGTKVFLELGAHRGEDTEWMLHIPGVFVHAVEPDPDNFKALATSEIGQADNLALWNVAITAKGGKTQFYPSTTGYAKQWTYSGSIREPKNHLAKHPSVKFGEPISVNGISLDGLAQHVPGGKIDFIWADIQGAEVDMIAGGLKALRNTHYLYTEYSDEELYKGQIGLLHGILDLLPNYRIIQRFHNDVLLVNTKWESKSQGFAA